MGIKDPKVPDSRISLILGNVFTGPIERKLGNGEIIRDYGDRVEFVSNEGTEIYQALGSEEGRHLAHQLGMDERVTGVEYKKQGFFIKTGSGKEGIPSGSEREEMLESLFPPYSEDTTDLPPGSGILGPDNSRGLVTAPPEREYEGPERRGYGGKLPLLAAIGMVGLTAAAGCTSQGAGPPDTGPGGGEVKEDKKSGAGVGEEPTGEETPSQPPAEGGDLLSEDSGYGEVDSDGDGITREQEKWIRKAFEEGKIAADLDPNRDDSDIIDGYKGIKVVAPNNVYPFIDEEALRPDIEASRLGKVYRKGLIHVLKWTDKKHPEFFKYIDKGVNNFEGIDVIVPRSEESFFEHGKVSVENAYFPEHIGPDDKSIGVLGFKWLLTPRKKDRTDPKYGYFGDTDFSIHSEKPVLEEGAYVRSMIYNTAFEEFKSLPEEQKEALSEYKAFKKSPRPGLIHASDLMSLWTGPSGGLPYGDMEEMVALVNYINKVKEDRELASEEKVTTEEMERYLESPAYQEAFKNSLSIPEEN